MHDGTVLEVMAEVELAQFGTLERLMLQIPAGVALPANVRVTVVTAAFPLSVRIQAARRLPFSLAPLGSG